MSTKDLKKVSPIFGQLIIGPPGSGKTTYCHKKTEFLRSLGRKVAIVNLDPANENMEYKANINIMDLITVADVMNNLNLGPNGALIYCMEFLETNSIWLFDKLKKSDCNYFMFDCPGQVELYTHHNSVRNIFSQLEKDNYHLCTVHLIDSHYCSEPHKFISTLLLSLNTMLQIGLPHVNVLSKADLFKNFDSKLLFNLEYYTDVLDLKYILEVLDSTTGIEKYRKLNAAIVSMVEDYSLVSFQPLDVNKKQSLVRIKNIIDKANGFVFGAGEEKAIHTMLACALGVETEIEKMDADINPYV